MGVDSSSTPDSSFFFKSHAQAFKTTLYKLVLPCFFNVSNFDYKIINCVSQSEQNSKIHMIDTLLILQICFTSNKHCMDMRLNSTFLTSSEKRINFSVEN